MSFFTSHYEKIILVVLLIFFASFLTWEVAVVQDVQNKQVDEAVNSREPDSDYVKVDFDSDAFKQSEIFSSRIIWENRDRSDDPASLSTDLMASYKMSKCPFCKKLIPFGEFPAVDAKTVGRCPLCKHELKPRLTDADDGLVEDRDANKNGVDDEVELKYGLDLSDPDAVNTDADGDGFTFIEEIAANTDPTNVKSHPRYATIVFVAQNGINKVPFKGLKVKNVSIPSLDDKAKWQVQFEYVDAKKNRKRNDFFNIGGEFRHRNETFKIVDVIVPEGVAVTDRDKISKESKVIICRKGRDERIECMTNATLYDPSEKISLVSLVNPKDPKERTETTWTVDSFSPVTMGNASTGVEKYSFKSTDKAGNSAVLVNADKKDEETAIASYSEYIESKNAKPEAPTGPDAKPSETK